ncbi:MAG TPA: GNAT family N-acetyltransferase [Acetobacteraceae bacterium]|nr:GNAT family N-acetyltransferase [Acetobacteraceae bacterium]
MDIVDAVTIRPSHDADLDAIVAIYGHHVRHGTASFETEPPPPEEMRRRRADLLARGFPYLVAEAGGTVLGYAYAGPYRPRAAYRDTAENSVYLRPDAAGQGIGTRLLTALIAECEALGLRQMVAVVGDSANLASIRLHQRCGFRLVGVLEAVGYKHGQWLDSVLLQRTLGDGSSTSPQRKVAE